MVEFNHVVGGIAGVGAAVTVYRHLKEEGWIDTIRETTTEGLRDPIAEGPTTSQNEHAPDNVVASGAMSTPDEETTIQERSRRRREFAGVEYDSSETETSGGPTDGTTDTSTATTSTTSNSMEAEGEDTTIEQRSSRRREFAGVTYGSDDSDDSDDDSGSIISLPDSVTSNDSDDDGRQDTGTGVR